MNHHKYIEFAKLFKTLGDPIRLQIVDLVSFKEMCACEILEYLQITQSTLSHHMKVLAEVEVVTSSKRATSMYYSINRDKMTELQSTLDKIGKDGEECFCYTDKAKKVPKCKTK